jgi:hypothetical protein
MLNRILRIFRKKPTQEFTLEQLKLIKELLGKDIEKISKEKQERIDELSKKGEVISTDKLLESLNELKAYYTGDNPEKYFAIIDKMKQDFREKYGSTIPVDLAYKISEGLEDTFNEDLPLDTKEGFGEEPNLLFEKYYNQSDYYSISLPTSWEKKEGYLESSVMARKPLKSRTDTFRENVGHQGRVKSAYGLTDITLRIQPFSR